MDVRAVLHVLGALLVFIGLTLLIPGALALVYDEGDALSFAISFVVVVLSGFAMWRLTPSNRELRIREGFGVVTFSWLLMSAFGALPFVLALEDFSYTDAFFETMSGFTTTGATILTDVEALPHGLLFWRSLTHWLGGMGIILLSLAILPMLGVGGMQLFKAEVPGPSVDKIQPRVQDTAKILWGVYVLLSAVEVVLLKVAGMNLFDAFCHTFGTMATGGFSTKNAGIPYFESAYIEGIITIFMILAGVNFSLHYRALRGNVAVYHRNSEFRLYVGIIAAVTLFLTLSVRFNNYDDTWVSFNKGAFQVASLLTTTGFHSADYELWSLPAQAILVIIMFVGGCAGSTGGGMKVVRVLLATKYAFVQLKKLVHPHAVIPIRYNKMSVSSDAITDVLGFLLVYMLLTVGAAFLMTLLGTDLITSISSVISSLSNIGPGIGAIGPTENFAHIPSAGKWLLSFLMLAGRLEIFTVLVIFSRHFWVR